MKLMKQHMSCLISGAKLRTIFDINNGSGTYHHMNYYYMCWWIAKKYVDIEGEKIGWGKVRKSVFEGYDFEFI